jgi:hypothetical protein
LELLLDQVVEEEVPILLVLEVETWEVLERLLEDQVETYLDQELLVPVEVVGTYQAHLGGQEEEAVLDQRDYWRVDRVREQDDQMLALKLPSRILTQTMHLGVEEAQIDLEEEDYAVYKNNNDERKS